MAKLFLFDVDLTLIELGGVGSRAFASAFEERYGIADAFAGIAFAGRTDSSLLVEAFSRHGVPLTDQPRAIARFQEAYFRLLEEALSNQRPGRTLPGVDRLLSLLGQRPGVSLGLATGNFRRSAFIKLEHFGLAGHFADGGFGDDSPHRHELVAIGIRRMEERLGYGFPRRDVYVVGDTPHDIASGWANGVATIAVATGRSSLEELAAGHPTHLFPDLSDAEGVVRTVLA